VGSVRVNSRNKGAEGVKKRKRAIFKAKRGEVFTSTFNRKEAMIA